MREFMFSDSDLNYLSNNVSMFSSHLLKSPRSMALRKATNTDDGDLILVVNSTDGTMAAFSILKPQNVVAPSEFVTNGTFLEVGTDLQDIYTIVKRVLPGGSTKYYLELFDDDRTTDAAIQYFSGAASPDQSLPTNTTCSSLSHLEGFAVDVVRDDNVITGKTVSSGAITIDQVPTTYVEVGLSYSVEVKTMPAEPRLGSGSVQSRKRRIVEVTPILDNAQNLALNGSSVSFRAVGASAGSAVTKYTGRKRVGPFFGYSDTAQVTMTMTEPLFCTVLAVEYKLSTGA